MRILFIHTIGKNKYGGGERWVVNAAAGLMQRGHKVFIGSRKNSELLKVAADRGINTVAFNINCNISIYMALKIALFLRRNKIDVVITKGRDLAVSGTAARLGLKPVVLVRSGLPPQSSKKKRIFFIKKLADGIITNTETIKDFYIQNGLMAKSFIKVIYNGLIIDDSLPSFDFSEKFPGKKIILSVGRLASQKAYNYLIDAAALLKEKNIDDVIFYVIGDGKLMNELVKYTEKKGVSGMVHFAGYRSQVVPYLKGCNMFLLTSLYEGMPNAAMEAMAYGKPVIMTNVNGAEELTDNGKYAILVPPEDPTAIAGSVKKILENDYDCLQLTENAKSFVRNNFRMDIMIDKIESFIFEKISQRQRKKVS